VEVQVFLVVDDQDLLPLVSLEKLLQVHQLNHHMIAQQELELLMIVQKLNLILINQSIVQIISPQV
jgi:hypothetical protein